LVELVNEDNGPSDEETYFNSDITAVEFGMRRISERNGFVRLFLTKDSSIGQFSPVRISVNLNGVSQIIEINEDVFAGNEHHIFDFAFIKGSPGVT
jgi:hypothetical protein